LLMFTKNKSPKVNYVSRLLVLPLAAIVFFAFTLKMKTITSSNFYDGKTITVVIDAGHGGEDDGVVSTDGLKEKDINLSIAKKIAELNSNDHIKVLLSRDNDKLIPLKDRVEFAKNNHSDLFISIHVNAADDSNLNENGFSVLIDKNNTDKNKLLASALIQELKKSYTTDDFVGLRKTGVWVLDNNICPAALIECGYLTYPADKAFITNTDNQEKIARNILDGIEKYAEQVTSANIDKETIQDTVPASSLMNKLSVSSNILYVVDGKIVPKEQAMSINPNDIQSINVLKDETAKKLYGEKGKNGVVIITKKSKTIPGTTGKTDMKPEPIYFVDGKEISKDELKANTISPSSIAFINILKGENAIKKYGVKAKNGVVEITTKNEDEGFTATADTIYMGGDSSSKPISSNAKFTGNVFYINSKFRNGTLILADGKEISEDEMKNIAPTNIQSINILKGETAIKKYGEKGKNGVVEIFLKAPGISQTDTIPDKVFTKVENEAKFPGGHDAWLKYMITNIKVSVDSFTDKDYGTCLLKFI
ncbi:MAG: N-acetylmuramoyl-L-alanine amidase, partial [Ginsengibacter sp.]